MNRSVSTSIALFCALSLFAGFASFGCGGTQTNTNTNTALMSPAPSTTVDCNSSGHDAILKAVYDAITKTYGPQEWQFNITENGKKLTIIGWSPDYIAIRKLVGDTAIGCTVDGNNFVAKFSDLGPDFRLIRACPTGYAPCGDICIPIGDFCQVLAGPAYASPFTCTLTGTPPPSPSPSASPVKPGNTAK